MHIKRFIPFFALALLMLAIPASSFAGVFVSVTVAPPVLPVYVQPPCPGDGYIWTPGYWAWGEDGYYWVPGTWVLAPAPGLLWTPGYWGWGGGVYVWHPGYWGPHVGFYGGVNYGFGYFGVGFAGGYWHGNSFFYNRSVTNVNVTNVHITNVYNQTVVNNNVNIHRVSYNGGAGGINARPRPEEERAFRERRFEASNVQVQHEHAARDNRAFLASVNHGRPEVAATTRPGEFHGHGSVSARPEGNFRPENHGGGNRGVDNHAMNRDIPRPQSSAHNMDRPMPHQDSYGNRNDHGNRGGRPEYNAPQSEMRTAPQPRPSVYHPEPSHQGNPRESAPHQEGAPHQQGREENHGHEHGR